MALERIVHESQRTDDVVQNIRAMFKSEGSSRSSINLNELINEVLRLTKGDLQKRAIIVRTVLDEKLPPVMANRVQLQQVLFNLVSNAIEAMDTASIRTKQLLIKSEPGTNGEVSVAVEDTGTGIDAKHIERVSVRSSLPRTRVWGWVYRSADQLLNRMVVVCGLREAVAMDRSFSSHCRSLRSRPNT